MLCCWEKPEVKTLSKPLLTESKSLTGEPKTLPERRPTGFEPLPEKSPSKSIPIPTKSVPVPDKLDLTYSSPAPLPAPIYAKSEIQMKPEPIELKSIPKPLAEVTPKEVAPVITKEIAPVIPKEVSPVIPKEVITEAKPVESKPNQKKNLKSNKRS